MAMDLSKLTTAVNGFSLVNIGLNAYGLWKHKKKVSVWTQDPDNPQEVFVGNIFNNKLSYGKEAGEYLSRSAIIIKADFSDPSKLCTHPVESGVLITDHKVILPKKCTLTLAMPAYYQDIVIKEIDKYFSQSTFLSVHDVSGVYNNMVIVNKPHLTDAKTADRLVFTLDLEEVLVVAPQYVKLTKDKVKAPKNASTVNSGIKQAKETSILEDIRKSGENVFYKFFKAIGV